MIRSALPRRSLACSSCKDRFVPKSIYYSVLEENNRHDYCPVCWPTIEKGSNNCYWKSCIAPRKPLSGSSRAERALLLFKELPEECELERYILALYLCREKLLFAKGEFIQEKRTYNIYESIEETAWIVPTLILSPSQVKEVQLQIAKQLQCNNI